MAHSSGIEVVVGLEVHAELLTASKIFCGCATTFGASPNTQVCPVCLGLPGSLPVLNLQVLRLALRAALALGCEIAGRTKFDRKNYFYPDLPKAYQISQFDLPLALKGHLTLALPEGEKRVGITRVHLEEDAGKLLHQSKGGQIGAAESSKVDYNRAGVPLIEIVSEPDLRSADEAYAYLTALKEILLFAGVSDCNMEEGSLRCDANISVRPLGTKPLGTKVEIKNMNSFKHVRAALEYEAKRQTRLLQEGGRIVQETRLWDADQGTSHSMRSKEEAQDYRYFPEPDLPEVVLSSEFINEVRNNLPELPADIRNRLIQKFGLPEYDAVVLTASPERVRYFEDAVAATATASPKGISNWYTVEILGRLNAEGKTEYDLRIVPRNLGRLVEMVEKEELSGKLGKEVLNDMFVKDQDPREIVVAKGLAQISDPQAIQGWIGQVLAEHSGPVAEYRAGKTQTLGFLVGQVLKRSAGKANPQLVQQLLKERLDAR